MKSFPITLAFCSLLFSACRDEKAPAQAPAMTDQTPVRLVGTQVSVSLNRAVLGLALDKPISRNAGSINGAEVSFTGYVRKETEHFLVMSKHPAPGQENEHSEALHWIPYSSILSIRQQYPNSKRVGEPADTPEPWRFEAVQNLMNLVGIDLTDVPEGKLSVWVERNEVKQLLDDVETHPGHEQWLYFGIDPYKSEALMMSVVSEENPGNNHLFLPLDQPKPFQKMIKGTPDWTKPVLIAAENHGASPGKIYAKLAPKK